MLLNGNSTRQARKFLECPFSNFTFISVTGSWKLTTAYAEALLFWDMMRRKRCWKEQLNHSEGHLLPQNYGRIFIFGNLHKEFCYFYVFYLRINPSLIFHMLVRDLYIEIRRGASLPATVKQILLSIWRRDCQSQDNLNFYRSAY